MSDERFDLSALDPNRDPEQVERMVGGIMARARSELSRRAAARTLTPFDVVAAWYRPALAAAAVIATVSVTLLATVGNNQSGVNTGAYMSGAEVPASMSSWYEEGRLPTASELLVVADQGGN